MRISYQFFKRISPDAFNFIYDTLIPIFHRYEDFVPILYTFEGSVPIIHIIELVLYTLNVNEKFYTFQIIEIDLT